MRHGIEVRSPFLDWRLVKFCFGLKNDMLVNNGYTKYILRQALAEKLPKSILHRKSKLGFLPSKQFISNIKCIKPLIHDTLTSREFIEADTFNGKLASKEILNFIDKDNTRELTKMWPLIQLTLFKIEWKKRQTLIT